MVLNRQMIKILEDMGVRDEWFFSQQKRELERRHAVTAGAWNTGAFCSSKASARHLTSRHSSRRSTMLKELRLLKFKARIPMPQGVTLFGIMDESGFLSEGEVSVCYDSCYNGSLPIDSTLNDGNIPVIRSPALYPGDIQ
ncbi:RNA-dependent RNA polymerase [Verticillium alfalfae VaMs.102]|uniref:RNA-dependent RNA polymerase n=1 Tax=Verticillium alfalfae (strain VaMs.102 / ATCC MYA-4576 / FGSC 10136) TaxID=526221 RepID=C9SLL5_VERA1|nr:RNA-dependent RNA polymerase [Verticillium alfalfae VaMs.102]EEY19583.1 RNA-dependent RNA polymerase [Verticillium alfalfae VaMs.102]